MTTNQVLQSIIDKNGKEYQATVAIEELAELMKELTKMIRGKGSETRICEELADVEICLAQIKLMFPRSKQQISLFKNYKLKRLRTLYIEGVER